MRLNKIEFATFMIYVEIVAVIDVFFKLKLLPEKFRRKDKIELVATLSSTVLLVFQ